jgi:isoquinoline 1-oxidoreductase beta subunit
MMIFVTNGLSRHGFLRTGAAMGGGLLLSLSMPLGHREAEAAGVRDLAANALVRVGNDGQIVVTMHSVEMSQGDHIAIALLIADELEADLARFRLEPASANDEVYGSSLLAGTQATGGLAGVRAIWMPMRQVAAIARIMLVTAASQRWKVDPDSCHAQSSEVIHASSGRRVGYGEVAAYAGRLPAPETVALKRSDMPVTATSVMVGSQMRNSRRIPSNLANS